jgi:hypothetical protein
MEGITIPLVAEIASARRSPITVTLVDAINPFAIILLYFIDHSFSELISGLM